jgi:hypothetical protein
MTLSSIRPMSLQAFGLAVSIFISVVCLASCAAIPFLLPAALQFASNLLMTSSKNYSAGYNEDLRALLTSLANPQATGQYGYSATTYPPPQTSTSYPNTAWSVYPPPPGTPPQGPALPQAPAPPPGSAPFPPQTSPPVTGMVYPSPPGSPPSPQFPAGAPTGTNQGYSANAGLPAVTPIAVDVALVRKTVANGRVVPVAIADGEVLRDGRGDPQAGDKFKIVVRPNTDCFLYIIAIDGSGWAQGLFPSKNSPSSNPVSSGREYVLPDGPYWYSLDQFRGVETIYVVASYRQRADIEAILTKIAGRERSPLAVPQQVQQAPVLPNGYGGTQPGQPALVQTESGTAPIAPTTFFAAKAGEDLRVTRWFRHE